MPISPTTKSKVLSVRSPSSDVPRDSGSRMTATMNGTVTNEHTDSHQAIFDCLDVQVRI